VLVMKDGRQSHGRCDIMKGDPANPHRAEDVQQKFFDLTVPVWGEKRAASIYQACMTLEADASAALLTRALGAAPISVAVPAPTGARG
jgi:2-methylcitrate dehydratase PrpD